MAALRKTLAHRLSKIAAAPASRPAHFGSRILPPDEPGPVRRFLSSLLQKRPIYQPVLPPDRLVERIRGLNPDRIRLDLLLPPPAPTPAAELEEEEEVEEKAAVPVAGLRKVARAWGMDAARARLRATGRSCVVHSDFLRICCEASGSDRGAEVARSLDESGVVIVWGDVVFLRPEEVAKAIEKVIPQSLAPWSDGQREREIEGEREELMKLEKRKEEIDGRAAAQVRRELWCGLGLLVAQTAAFMRLTFWELSWDVMEPICFFVTSIYFMAGYTFFLRTSKEPSFEGFFQTRLAARQQRLMKATNFDVHRFNQLRRARSHPPSYCHCHCVGRAR